MSVDLPQPLGPITTTSEGGGSSSARSTSGTCSFLFVVDGFWIDMHASDGSQFDAALARSSMRRERDP